MISAETETVVWDLDGTILDSFGILKDGLDEVLPNHGLTPPAQHALATNFHGSLEHAIDGALGGLEPELLHTIVDEFLVIQDQLYEHPDEHLFADAVDLMRRLHEAGKRQIIVTNRAHQGRLRASPRSIVSNSILDSYVDMVLCGDDGVYRKPNAAVLDTVKAAGLIPLSPMVIIGDQFVDAQFAHNLNSSAILVDRSDSIHHLDRLEDGWQDRTHIVRSLNDVVV
jgi:phosphoglycolate phosphatase-like HAD superfamily hydrolase